MKHSRLLVLNLYIPVGVAIYIGVGRALPTVNINTLKTFIIYACCALPIYFIAHLGSQLALKHIKPIKTLPQLALISGAVIAIVFAYFYLRVFYVIVWELAPWLEGGFTYKYYENAFSFWDYLHSSTGLLFTPTWFLVNAAYEYASGDRLYFPDEKAKAGQHSAAEPNALGTPTLQQTGLLSKLPAQLRPAIIALEAQQHYVCVHTDSGSEIVLYRFGDAVHEFEAQGLGLQVHRSFLIVPDAVVETQRSGRSLFLAMRNGLQVPVSQSYRGLVARFQKQSDQNLPVIGSAPSTH